MTKKHFIALADAIKEHNNMIHTNHFTEDQLNTLAEFCRQQNVFFDRDRWMGYIAGTNGPNGGKK